MNGPLVPDERVRVRASLYVCVPCLGTWTIFEDRVIKELGLSTRWAYTLLIVLPTQSNSAHGLAGVGVERT